MYGLRVDAPEKLGFFFRPLGITRYRVTYGGRGSTKSWTIARALLVHGYQRRLRILCAREFQASIADSVHKLLKEQATAIRLAPFYRFLQTSITGRNGTEFIFEGLRRNVQEIKSKEGIDVAWVEEAEAVSDESWRTLIPTVRKPGSEIWVSFNPALETDPTWRRFVKDPPARSLVQFVSWRDNPWLPTVLREEREELLRKDPEAEAHVWGGQPWRRTEAQILYDKVRVDEFTPGDEWSGPYYGLDFGFANDPACITRSWLFASRLFVEYDVRGVRWGNDELARRIRTVPDADDHTVRADSARPETIWEMQQRDLDVVACPKWSGSVKDGIAHLRTYEEIVIHPRCEGLIQEARLYSYKTDARTGDVLPDVKDAHNHGWDSIRYALNPLIQRPEPKKRAEAFYPGMPERVK